MTLSASEILLGIAIVGVLFLVEALFTRLVEATRPARPASRKIQAPHRAYRFEEELAWSSPHSKF